MKIVALSIKGKEFLFSYKNAFFAPNSSAQKMADILNRNKYMITEDTIWFVHDRQYEDTFKISKKLYFNHGKLKSKYI